MRLALGCTGGRILIRQELQVVDHGDHFRTIFGQRTAVHAAHHASVDPVLDGFVSAAAR